MDDDVELRRLRERVYGAEGAAATPAMIERLSELEDRVRRSAVSDAAAVPEAGGAHSPASAHPSPLIGGQPAHAGPTPPASFAAPVTSTSSASPPTDGSSATPTALAGPDPAARAAPDPAAPESLEHPSTPDATPLTPRRVLRLVLTAVGALALLGIGIAIGASTVPTSAVTPDPAAAAYPELTFPQTSEDVISADILSDSGIDAASTRYIATVSDFRIYLAQPDDGDGRCIVTFTSSDNRPWSAGCASGAQQGAAIFGVDDTLTVAIGDPDDSAVSGIPIRLSESVTAYVAQ